MTEQTMTASLVAKQLFVRYGDKSQTTKVALSGVDLTVNKGEFVSVIGPSGGGKSTLLHCLGGLLKPSSGEVWLNGSPLVKPDAGKAAFVFQDYSLLPWKKVLDNVAIGLRFAGVPKARRHERAMECLTMVGMQAVAESYPHQLSGGMQQRVGIARALASDPEILLMDEPFGALDEQTRRELGIEMSESVWRAGKTVLMITHSLDEAIFWADRVIVLSAAGQVVEEFHVTESRPRTDEFMLSEQFIKTRESLWRWLSRSDEPAPVDSGSLSDAPASGHGD